MLLAEVSSPMSVFLAVFLRVCVCVCACMRMRVCVRVCGNLWQRQYICVIYSIWMATKFLHATCSSVGKIAILPGDARFFTDTHTYIRARSIFMTFWLLQLLSREVVRRFPERHTTTLLLHLSLGRYFLLFQVVTLLLRLIDGSVL